MNVRRNSLRIIVALLGAVASLSAVAYAPPTHRYYRFVIDSVGSNTDGYSSVNELQLKIGGVWLVNSNSSVGNNTHGLVRFGPSMGTSYQATVDLTDECCDRDLSQLFDGLDDVAWVAGVPYQAFATGATGDSLVADSIWAKFDFGDNPIALDGVRVFGDPWPNGGAAGAEAPDRFRIQYSDNGVDYFTAYETSEDAVTSDGAGFDALLEPPHRYYRLVIDSVGSNTDGYSSVNELQLKIAGVWRANSNSSIGNSTQGLVRFGPSIGTSYQATVDLTDNCCARDLSQLFDGLDQVSWVAGVPYHPFAIGATGDSLVADSIWATFDFGNNPIALDGMRVFGDPWDNGSAAGAEAPDRFRIQYSNNGVDYVTVYQTHKNAVTFNGAGFDALLETIFGDGFE